MSTKNNVDRDIKVKAYINIRNRLKKRLIKAVHLKDEKAQKEIYFLLKRFSVHPAEYKKEEINERKRKLRNLHE